MATALGQKTWATGDVPTATEFNGLNGQTTGVFASTSARDTAWDSGEFEGAFAYTTDTGTLWLYNGAAWIPYWSEWQTFTPAWGNITEGNGTNTGRYRYQGGDLVVVASLAFGSTSAFTGAPDLTLPNSETSASWIAEEMNVGGGYFRENGGLRYPVNCRIGGSDQQIAIRQMDTSSNPGEEETTYDANTPFTWGTDDVISCQVTIPL